MDELKRVPAHQLFAGLWAEVPLPSKREWDWRLIRHFHEQKDYVVLQGEDWDWRTSPDTLVLVSRYGPPLVKPRVTVPTWDEYFLGIAQAVAARAKCRRRQVGSVLVAVDQRIIATGYNGYPSGVPDCLEGFCRRGLSTVGQVAPDSDYNQIDSPGYCKAIHAEVNSLLHAGKDTRGATIYITDSPCPECQRSLAGAGVVRAVWPEGEVCPLDLYRRPPISS